MSDSTVVVRPDLKAELEREKTNLARIHAGLDQARRGEFATDEEVRDFFAKRAAPRA